MDVFLNWVDKAWIWICEYIDVIVSNTAFWQVIYSVADFIGIVVGIVVGIIAIVTFLETYYFKRIKILSWYKSANIYDGHRFGVTVQNRCLSTLAIKRVSIILEEAEEVVLFHATAPHSDDPTTSLRSIEPFKTEMFTSNGSTVPLFDKGNLENYRKIVFCFTHSDDSQTKVRYRLKKIKKNKYKTLFPKQVVYRGVRLTEHMMYIVESTRTARPSTQHIVFENGMLEGKIGTVSKIPSEHCNSADALKQYLEESNPGIIFNVYTNPHYKQD